MWRSEKETEGSSQRQKYIEATCQTGTDMTKEEFSRVIDGLAKPRPRVLSQGDKGNQGFDE